MSSSVAPKHPASAYVFYLEECQPRLQCSRPDLSFAEIAKIIGTNWQTLSPEDREKYNIMAGEDKARYNREMMNYMPDNNSSNGGGPNKRRKRNPNAPKHPISAYLFFVAESRSRLSKESPSMPFGDMAKKIGAQWKAMSGAERSAYEIMAGKDKVRYEQQLQSYVKYESDGIRNLTTSNHMPNEPQKRRKRAANAPKHPVSAYLFYVAEQRRLLSMSNPGKSFKELATEIGGRWKSLAEEERMPYAESAARDKERYEREKADLIAMGNRSYSIDNIGSI